MSPIFESNVGSDNAVFRFTETGISQPPRNSSGAQGYGPSFEAEDQSAEPGFFYDPAKGNLLMDIQGLDILPRASVNFFFDAVTLPGSSSVHYRVPDDTVEGTLSSKALVVLFVFKPVPEPSVIALAGLGLAALCWAKTRHFTEGNEDPEGSAGDKDEGS